MRKNNNLRTTTTELFCSFFFLENFWEQFYNEKRSRQKTDTVWKLLILPRHKITWNQLFHNWIIKHTISWFHVNFLHVRVNCHFSVLWMAKCDGPGLRKEAISPPSVAYELRSFIVSIDRTILNTVHPLIELKAAH